MEKIKGMILENDTHAILWDFDGNEEKMVIPETVKELKLLEPDSDRLGIFLSHQTTLKEAYIPASVEHIDDCFFSKYTRLEKIEVTERSEYYESIDGVLYVKDGKELIRYPSNKKGDTFIVPDRVERIHDEAFYNCHLLETIVIHPTVKYVGRKAFAHCKNLKNVEYKCRYQIVPEMAFDRCQSVISVALSDNIQEIQCEAFSFTSITEMKFPERLSTIGAYAFRNCKNLRKITINKNMRSISSRAFFGCKNLNEIDTGNNGWYRFEDGGLFTRDLKKLVMFVDRKIEHYEIPVGVGIIGNSLFADADNLITIKIPDTVTEIEDFAFKCARLESITIPKSVHKIGKTDFFRSRYFRELRYEENNVIIRYKIRDFGKKFTHELESLTLDKWENRFNDLVSDFNRPRGYSDEREYADIHIQDIDSMPDKYKDLAILGFIKEKTDWTSERSVKHLEYIRKNAGSLCRMALDNPDLLLFMCKENLIGEKHINQYIKKVKSKKSVEIRAMILNHKYSLEHNLVSAW